MYHPQIQTFIEVADCGSFTKAAEKLFITAASVMKQMNALESRIGVTLLERTNHGVTLTAAGRSVYKDAQHIIAESVAAIRRARELGGMVPAFIRVGTSLLNPCKLLIDLWGNINERDLPFQIKIVPFEDNHLSIFSIIESLGSKFDFLVGACGSEQWKSRCNFYQLGNYQVCCAVSRKHRLAGRPLLSITDLYGENLMMVRRGDSQNLDRLRDLLEEQHSQIRIVDTPYFYDAEVFNDCERTNSVLLTLNAWADVHPSLITIPVDWEFTIPYGLMYSKNPSPETLSFLHTVKAAGARTKKAPF